MAQNLITFNDEAIPQPDEGLGYDFETTYTEDTKRVQSGVLHATPLFTVEAFSYSASNLSFDEAYALLKHIAKGRNFYMFYPSLYYNKWRRDLFYVGKGSLSIGRVNTGEEMVDSISFNIIGVNPI